MFYNINEMKYFTILVLASLIFIPSYFYVPNEILDGFSLSSVSGAVPDYSDVFLYANKFSGRVKPLPNEVKAIHLSYGFYNSSRFDGILAQLPSSPINALVFEIKDPFGRVAVHDNAHTARLQELLPMLSGQGIYTIARIVLFQDPALVQARADLAIHKTTTNAPWQDFKGMSWVDPTNSEVWAYNIEIARAAQNLGFDEINFDYIRFPTDGPTDDALYAHLSDFTNKSDAIRSFLQLAQAKLDAHTKLSIDVFGMTFIGEQERIGQNIEELAPYVDIIAPMPYPSHFPKGFLGYDDPSQYPYEVIAYTLQQGRSKFALTPNVIVRPWLQAFSLGVVYDSAKIQAQVQAVQDNGITSWWFWNSGNIYNNYKH